MRIYEKAYREYVKEIWKYFADNLGKIK